MKKGRLNGLLPMITFLLLSVGLRAQEVTGVVFGEDNMPIPGVNVVLEGSSTGAVTNFDGEFSIQVDDLEEAVLTFSFVGFDTKSIAISGRTYMEVQLVSDSDTLEEVVVVGYGTQRKADVTGSVVSANIENFQYAPNTNIAQSLQGTVPGLNVGQVTSAGQTPSISIRGQSTISGNSSVLVILDGIQYDGSLSALNPDDIESIDVLKDASSTAIYGAQAANGVILITTKKGRNEAPSITLSSSYTVQTPTKDFRPMRRAEYLDYIRDLFYTESYLGPDYLEVDPNFNIADLVDPIMKDENGNLLPHDFDWWDAATDEGFVKEVKASVTGGTEHTSYLISLGFTDQEGFIKNDKFQRKNLRINLEVDATDWWTVGVQSFGSFVNADGAEPNLAEIIRQSPLLVPFDENGDLIPYPFNTKDLNPFINYYVDDYDRENYFFANLYSQIDFPFLEGLSYRVNFGNNYRMSNHHWASEYGAGLTGAAYKHHNEYYDYTLDNILSYKNTFQDHQIDITLLYGARERKNNYTSASSQDIPRLTLGYHSLQQGVDQFADSNAWSESMLYQMFRFNYRFKDRYLLTGTIRRDGFSGFAENQKYGYFPSVAAGWILSEESFFQPEWVDFLKLRVGYGLSGNKTQRYNSLATISGFPGYVFGDGGTTEFRQAMNSLANPNLKWEKTEGFNLGLEFTLIDYRLEGTIDYYNSTTRDLLFNVAIPWITGFSDISTNLGRLHNEGLEIALTSHNVRTENFQWSTTLNFSTNSNEILELTGMDEDGDGREDDLVASNLFIGESLGTIYGYETDGMYQIGDEIPSGYYPGSYRIVDQNDDGVISPDDRVILGSNQPAFRASLFNKINYRNFGLSVFLNSIQGGKDGYLGSNSRPLIQNDNNRRYNNFTGLDYWHPGNPDAENPRMQNSPAISPGIYKDRSFIRLQDVTLSYSLGERALDFLNVKDFNLFVSGKNLVTWTDWNGWDPETNQGLTINGRPVMKAYSAGFNITF